MQDEGGGAWLVVIYRARWDIDSTVVRIEPPEAQSSGRRPAHVSRQKTGPCELLCLLDGDGDLEYDEAADFDLGKSNTWPFAILFTHGITKVDQICVFALTASPRTTKYDQACGHCVV